MALRSFYPVFAALALIFSAIFLEAASHAAEQRRLPSGEKLYNAKCARCHGDKGVGTVSGPPLVHRIYEPNHHSDLAFHWAVEKGVRAHHWQFGNMPKIEGLSTEDVDAVIQYIRRLQYEAGIY